MAKTGYAGAVDRLNVIVRWRPLNKRLIALARSAPHHTKLAMGRAVAWWHSQALPRLPVSAGYPRGRLKAATQPYVTASGSRISGGIRAMVPYAIWLAAGTRYIAGGAVMRWRPGQPTIKRWPAKEAGGGARGELPIILPWQAAARKRLAQELRKEILE